MANYTTLTGAKTVDGSIKGWVNWDKAPVTTILSEAEAWIFRQLRVREMKTRLTGTIALDAVDMTLPTGWVGPISFYRTGEDYGKITPMDPERFESFLGYDELAALVDGTPRTYAFDSTKIYFDVKADKAYPYTIWYWKEPGKLSGSNETNFLTEKHPLLLRAACLGIANAHRKDEKERDSWLAFALQQIHLANAEADLEMVTGDYDIHWGNQQSAYGDHY